VRASTEFVHAGNWVFGTGLRGAATPEFFRTIEKKLAAAGSSMALVARLDQYYPRHACVAPYQAARKQAFERRQVAPSTSVVVSGLADRQAEVDVQIMAATAASGYRLEEIGAGLNRPETSGYAPCLRVADLVFVAGQLARDRSGALAARGTAAETRYIFLERLVPALEAAGSGPELVLKAQAYLTGSQDDFDHAWANLFGGRAPPTTAVTLRHPAFLTPEATVEINLIAAHRSARERVRHFDSAMSLDGLLFLPGLSGDMPGILDRARRIFATTGASLSHIVRALVFHPGGFALDPAMPFTAVEVQAGLTVDLWGYAP